MAKTNSNDSRSNQIKSLLGFCGLDCGECEVFIATLNGSTEMKKSVADKWSKLSGRQLKAEDITCVGCVIDGRHYPSCAICEVRECGLQKNVQNCGYCNEVNCQKLERFHAYSPKAKVRLEQIKKQIK